MLYICSHIYIIIHYHTHSGLDTNMYRCIDVAMYDMTWYMHDTSILYNCTGSSLQSDTRIYTRSNLYFWFINQSTRCTSGSHNFSTLLIDLVDLIATIAEIITNELHRIDVVWCKHCKSHESGLDVDPSEHFSVGKFTWKFHLPRWPFLWLVQSRLISSQVSQFPFICSIARDQRWATLTILMVSLIWNYDFLNEWRLIALTSHLLCKHNLQNPRRLPSSLSGMPSIMIRESFWFIFCRSLWELRIRCRERTICLWCRSPFSAPTTRPLSWPQRWLTLWPSFPGFQSKPRERWSPSLGLVQLKLVFRQTIGTSGSQGMSDVSSMEHL